MADAKAMIGQVWDRESLDTVQILVGHHGPVRGVCYGVRGHDVVFHVMSYLLLQVLEFEQNHSSYGILT